MSWPILATETPPSTDNVLLVRQKLAVLKFFASSFMKWSVRKQGRGTSANQRQNNDYETPTTAKDVCHFPQCVCPTMTNTEEVKEEFHSNLRETIRLVPSNDRLILVGDFNAKVDSDTEKWRGVLGSHGVGKCNANGELLLSLCSEYNLVVTNTLFKYEDTYKMTWTHPRSKH